MVPQLGQSLAVEPSLSELPVNVIKLQTHGKSATTRSSTLSPPTPPSRRRCTLRTSGEEGAVPIGECLQFEVNTLALVVVASRRPQQPQQGCEPTAMDHELGAQVDGSHDLGNGQGRNSRETRARVALLRTPRACWRRRRATHGGIECLWGAQIWQ
ncbi:hypothetical protein PG994_007463 [Apiospora phragmitis]|uniref:Uncharacterized protein n=1 Tax=Apiospora phragmitis TaxID=2905665 RepID=A0ABR1V0W4_9PEZI